MLPEAIELQIVTPERHVLQETVQTVEIPGRKATSAFCRATRRYHGLGVGILAYRKAPRAATSR